MVYKKKDADYSVATFAMSHALAKRIKGAAAGKGDRGISMSAYIREAVEAYLAADEKRQTKRK